VSRAGRSSTEIIFLCPNQKVVASHVKHVLAQNPLRCSEVKDLYSELSFVADLKAGFSIDSRSSATTVSESITVIRAGMRWSGASSHSVRVLTTPSITDADK